LSVRLRALPGTSKFETQVKTPKIKSFNVTQPKNFFETQPFIPIFYLIVEPQKP